MPDGKRGNPESSLDVEAHPASLAVFRRVPLPSKCLVPHILKTRFQEVCKGLPKKALSVEADEGEGRSQAEAESKGGRRGEAWLMVVLYSKALLAPQDGLSCQNLHNALLRPRNSSR